MLTRQRNKPTPTAQTPLAPAISHFRFNKYPITKANMQARTSSLNIELRMERPTVYFSKGLSTSVVPKAATAIDSKNPSTVRRGRFLQSAGSWLICEPFQAFQETKIAPPKVYHVSTGFSNCGPFIVDYRPAFIVGISRHGQCLGALWRELHQISLHSIGLPVAPSRNLADLE